MPRPSPRLPYKPHSLLIPRRPNFSALLIHRIPLHRYKQKQTLKLSAHPRLAKLFPRAESKVDRNEKLKKVVKVERRVLGDHFAHLKSRSVVGRTRKVKVKPGKLKKTWTQIPDRVAFFNIAAGDKVRVVNAHEEIMWLPPKKGKKGPSEREEGERVPKVFTVKHVRKETGQVYLEGLSYEEWPELADPSRPNATKRVSIPIHYSQLQLRIPNDVIKQAAKEAGVEVGVLPRDVFATRLQTTNIRAPDFRTKVHRWEKLTAKRYSERSTSFAGLRRTESRLEREGRLEREKVAREGGLVERVREVVKSVSVERLDGQVETEEKVVKVLETLDREGLVLSVQPAPVVQEYTPRAFAWDRVVKGTYPPINLKKVVKRELVEESETEVKYREVERRFRIKVPFRTFERPTEVVGEQELDDTLSEAKRAQLAKRMFPSPSVYDTPRDVVASPSWSPPDVQRILDLSFADKSVPDDYLQSRVERLEDDAIGLDHSTDAQLPIEFFVGKELANPYGSDRREKARRQRSIEHADRLAEFVSDLVGAHLVREQRVREGVEPRVGRKMTVDEVILTARRRWAEKMTEERQAAKVEYAERMRAKWGPTKTEIKSLKKLKKKERLLQELRRTTLVPGRNQVIPPGLERVVQP